MEGALLLCCDVFATLGNPMMNKEVTNLQRKKKSCFNRDHYIVRKIIIFSLIYITTKKAWLALLIVLLITFFNYRGDYQDSCDEYEDFKQK